MLQANVPKIFPACVKVAGSEGVEPSAVRTAIPVLPENLPGLDPLYNLSLDLSTL